MVQNLVHLGQGSVIVHRLLVLLYRVLSIIVSLHVAFLGKSLISEVAAERLFIRVHSLVHVQVEFTSEDFVSVVALVVGGRHS